MKKALITATAAGLALATGLASVHAAETATSGYHVIDRIAGPDGGWDYANVDPFNKQVLVAKGANIVAIDLKTGKVNPTFASAMGAHGAIGVDGGKQVAFTNGGNATVSFVDAKTGAPLASVPVAKGADAISIDPKTGYVLSMGHSSGDVSVIDPKTHTVVGTITVGGTLEGGVADGEGKAYINVEDKGEVVAVDLKTFKALAHYPVAGCEGPTGIDYDKASKLLVVACEKVAKILNAKTGAVVASIPTGPGADGDAIYQKGELAFVSAGGDGTLAVISLKGGKPMLLENIATQKGARTIAVDQDTGRVYLPAAETAAPVAGARRGAQIPGSFKVLVVGK
jgi:YVTN family beta-propeller protein